MRETTSIRASLISHPPHLCLIRTNRTHDITTLYYYTLKYNTGVCSSQSLYSFLQSSDEFEGQEFSSRQNSEPEDKEKSIRQVVADSKPGIHILTVLQVARPVLSEPFWNEGLTLSKAMMFTYELPESDLATILARDRERLKDMRQPDMVEEQLRVSI